MQKLFDLEGWQSYSPFIYKLSKEEEKQDTIIIMKQEEVTQGNNVDDHYKKHLIEPIKHDHSTPRNDAILPPADPLPGKFEMT